MGSLMLKKEDYFVDENIKKAETLPPEAFYGKDFSELEKRTVFKNHWLAIPNIDSAKIAEPGSFMPFELMGTQLLLSRDLEGKLHCLSGVCTHKWKILADKPQAKKQNITCPYHGRKFFLDGKFLSQAGYKTAENSPRPCDNLQSFSIKEWWKLFFICFGKPAADFASIFKDIDESLQNYPLGKCKYRKIRKNFRLLEGNYKQHADNYLDYFHTPFVHAGKGGLKDKVDFESYKNGLEAHENSFLQWAYAKNPKHGIDPKFLPERFLDQSDHKRRVYALWWFIPPNLTINVWPWGVSINIYEPCLRDPTKTKFWWQHYVLDPKKYRMRDKIWLNKEVDEEDIAVVASVKKGILSGAEFCELANPPRGRFMPEYEQVSHWYHRWIYKNMFKNDRNQVSVI